MAHILPSNLQKGGRKVNKWRGARALRGGLPGNLIVDRGRGRQALRGKKLVVFAVAFVAFAVFFYLLDHGLQSWQGLELFPSGEH